MLVSDDDMMIHRIYIYIFHAHFTAHEIPLLVGLWVWFVLAMSVYENGNKLYNIVIVSIYPMILPLTYNKLTKSKCVYSLNDYSFVGDENKCPNNKYKYISKYECIYKYMVKVDFRSAVQMSMDDANKFRLITC